MVENWQNPRYFLGKIRFVRFEFGVCSLLTFKKIKFVSLKPVERRGQRFVNLSKLCRKNLSSKRTYINKLKTKKGMGVDKLLFR